MKKKILMRILSVSILLVTWEIVIRYFNIPEYTFPGPIVVMSKMYLMKAKLAEHFLVTFFECLLGFFCGFIVAVILAIAVIHSKWVETITEPPIVGMQSIPKIAIAPLIIMWFGLEMGPKIFLAALLSFFPIFISLVSGLRHVNSSLLDIMKIYKANKRQLLVWARIPNALPELFSGITIALPASIVGAIVGEWLGAEKGIGYLIINSQANLDTPAVFAELLVLGFMGMAFICLARFIERKTVYWRKQEQGGSHPW